MNTYLKSMALAVGLVVSAGANASLLGLYGDGDTSPYVITGDNDYAPLVGLAGFVGGHVFNSSAGAIKVTYEYLFKEASFVNKFQVGVPTVFTTGLTPYGATATQTVAAGADLDFDFLTGSGVRVDNDRTSASQNDGTAAANFFLYFNGDGSVYAALDDGHIVDDNHDDLIVKITAASVPEPMSLGLLGLGALGVFGATRSRARV